MYKNKSDKQNYDRNYKRSHYNRDQYKLKKRSLERHHRLRRMTIDYYSNGTMRCACCGIGEYKFLVIDHIDGGGRTHVAQFKSRAAYIGWFIKNNFPPGFQVLCYNCNCCKGYYGKCVHEEMRALSNEIKKELK